MGLFQRAAANVYVGGKKVLVSPADSIGKGGEADVYRLEGGIALKIFKTPEHPDFAGDVDAMEGARARLLSHQTKLPVFPRALPSRVVGPNALATDKGGQEIVGYTMRLVEGADVLSRWAEPGYRRAHVALETLSPLLVDLMDTLSHLHKNGIVIGDFNDLNVLVRGKEAHLIDADSFQFGTFPCTVYTERFLDPILAGPNASQMIPTMPYSQESDWYAFAVLAFQTLLCVGPYGGVYRPKAESDRVSQEKRPLHRISVFHPNVVYPKPAVPWSVLPDELLHVFSRTFDADLRRPLPRDLLCQLTWSKCLSCGLEHARNHCPTCVKSPTKGPTIAREVVRGSVTRTLIRQTRGRIVAAEFQGGAMRYLVYENGAYMRENGRTVLRGDHRNDFHFWLLGQDTLVENGGNVVVIDEDGPKAKFQVDVCGNRAALATNETCHFRAEGGALLRTTKDTSKLGNGRDQETRMGDVLSAQTQVWVGEKLGFGVYRAGQLSVAFVFRTNETGLLDTVRLPYPTGQVLNHEVHIAEDHIWVLFAAQKSGRTVHIATRIRSDGTVDAMKEAYANDGSWLSTLDGKCAAGRSLLAATDAGIIRIEERSGDLIETRHFSDTEPFVTSATKLVPAPFGLFLIEPQAIYRLLLS